MTITEAPAWKVSGRRILQMPDNEWHELVDGELAELGMGR